MIRMSMTPSQERWQPIAVALVIAALLQVGLVALLNVRPPPTSVPSDPPAIAIEFVTLAPPVQQPVQQPVDQAATTTQQQAPEAVPQDEALPAETAVAVEQPALPSIDLPPPDGPTDASEAAAALRSYFCIEVRDDGLQDNDDCNDVDVARPGSVGSEGHAETEFAEYISARRASNLGLGLAPGQVPPPDAPHKDPYAPDDHTFTNPVEDVRGEIFW